MISSSLFHVFTYKMLNNAKYVITNANLGIILEKQLHENCVELVNYTGRQYYAILALRLIDNRRSVNS